MVENQVRTQILKSWDDFISQVRENEFVGPRIFRGHREPSWKLSSIWERLLDRQRGGDSTRSVREYFADGAFEAWRDSYIEKFKDLAIGLPGLDVRDLEPTEWLMLARHSGLISPILDWTRSPYVAAYHAFRDLIEELNPGFSQGMANGFLYGSGYVTVWSLLVDDLLFSEKGLSKKHELEIFEIRSQFAYRQKAQQGVGTRLSHDLHTDLEAYLASRGLAHFLTRFNIPRQEMGKALWDLQLMNINPATLYPDLTGAAELANTWHLIQGLGETIESLHRRNAN
jgi:hypothetical protein